MTPIVSVIVFLLSIGAIDTISQTPVGSCSKMKYESHSQVDPKTLVVSRIVGQVLDGPDSKKSLPLSSVCIAIFDERTKRQVKVVEPDDSGNFRFRNVRDGSYRLVVKSVDGGFCVASIPVRMTTKTRKYRKIIVHMLLTPAIDRCSFGEIV